MLRRPLSNTSAGHFRSILQILNQRLSEADAHEQDILPYVVSILASIAILFGDYNAAKTHAKGLSDIIRLRGGPQSFSHIPVIQLSIDRYVPSLKRFFPCSHTEILVQSKFFQCPCDGSLDTNLRLRLGYSRLLSRNRRLLLLTRHVAHRWTGRLRFIYRISDPAAYDDTVE